MDETLTDRDQEERLRNFFSENWRWMLAGIVLGVGGLVGWNRYEAHALRKHESAASEYANLLKTLAKGDDVQAKNIVDELAADHPNSAYADQARLLLAKMRVEKGRYDEAIALLQSVADKSRDPQLADLARTRLARVLQQAGKPAEALAALELEKDSAYEPLAHEIRGDIHYAQGKMTEARAEYAAALEGDSAVIDRPYIELKLQQVGGKADAPAPVEVAK